MMLQNHASVNDPFKVQDRTIGCNVTAYEKFIDTLSDSAFATNL